MIRLALRGALPMLLALGSPVLQAQPATHLNVPVKQMIRVQFQHSNSDPWGHYSFFSIISADGSYGTTWSIPAGFSLVITDLMIQGSTSYGYAGDNTGTVTLGWFDPGLGYIPSTLWSETVKLEATGYGYLPYGWSRSFTAGFRFPGGGNRRPAVRLSLPWIPSGQNPATITALGYLVSDN